MATSNIQSHWLESNIYYIENIEDDYFQYEDLKSNIENDISNISISLYDRDMKEYINLNFQIAINDCYYDWVNLTINCNKELGDFNLSKTSDKKIEKIIKKLEKTCEKYSIKLKCIWRASNWEAFYEKI